MGKPAWQSKTLWLNVVIGIALAVSQSSNDIAAAAGIALDPKMLTLIGTIGNVLLRIFGTSQPIKSVV